MRFFTKLTKITHHGYDAPSETLELRFDDGMNYQFYNVGQELYDAFKSSTSKTQFFIDNIKTKFPYSRVDG